MQRKSKSGVICFLAVSALKSRFGYDDSLDAFGVHGIGGTWGALATGLFMQVRADEAQEFQGLDISEQGVRGYAYQDLVSGSPAEYLAISPQHTVASKTIMA